MFLIMGIQEGRKQLKFDQLVVCKACGRYGHVQIFMYYTYFMLFFIPIFKWNRRYVAVMDCCNAYMELSRETGEAIADGSLTYLSEDMLDMESGLAGGIEKHCDSCGYSTCEDFEFCPKCGRRFS